jgi:hypothetical protein
MATLSDASELAMSDYLYASHVLVHALDIETPEVVDARY